MISFKIYIYFFNSKIKERTDLYLNDTISLFNENLGNEIEAESTRLDFIVENFFNKLKESVMKRVSNLPRLCKACATDRDGQVKKFTSNEKCEHAKLAVLFSGGVDSSVLAALADICCKLTFFFVYLNKKINNY